MPTYPITAVIPRVQYISSSLQINFAYNWPIFSASDLLVYKTPVGQLPSEVSNLLTLNLDYTVTNVGLESGGFVILTLPAVAGSIITIQRSMAVERTTNYTNGNAINASDLNSDFDRLTMMIQDVNAFIKRISTRYTIPAVVPAIQQLLPQLPNGYIFRGGLNDSIVPVLLEENPDASTLRSELAYNATADGAGANLVGYFDTDSGPQTVREKLDSLSTSVNIHVLSILSFGADPTGVENTTPALNAAYNYCVTNSIGVIWFPRGTYRFTTQPDNMPQLIKIRGDGITLTSMLRDFSPTGTDGLFMSNGNFCGQYSGFSIFATTGTIGGTGINIVASSNINAQLLISDVYIGNQGGSYDYDIVIDGENNALISIGKISGVYLDSASTANILLQNCENFEIDLTTKNGTETSTAMIITGDVTRPSKNITANISSLENLSLDFTENSTFNLTDCVNVTNTSNTDLCTIYGSVSGVKETDWVNSRYITNQDFNGSVVASGYQKLPNGLILQWINAAVTSPGFSLYNLPIPFSAVNFGVFGFCSETNGEVLLQDTANHTLSAVSLSHAGISALDNFKILVLGR